MIDFCPLLSYYINKKAFAPKFVYEWKSFDFFYICTETKKTNQTFLLVNAIGSCIDNISSQLGWFGNE